MWRSEKVKWLLSSKVFYFLLFALIALIPTIRNIAQGASLRPEFNNGIYTSFNNYLIFKQSFFHLLHQKNLYILYIQEHWDYFKYTPTFSLFFGVFSYLPDWAGLFLWNLLNCWVLLLGILALKPNSVLNLSGICLLITAELYTATLNSQSNGLISGLLLLAFSYLENKKYFLAILLIVSTAYIKLFGLVLLSLLVFYPLFLRNALYSLLIILLFFLAPIPFCGGWDTLILQYESYLNLLGMDHQGSVGYSMMGWLKSWFHLEVDKSLLVIIGLFIQIIPMAKLSNSTYSFRMNYLCSWLIWLVIFNHKAESPTFIIAATGVLVWFFLLKEKRFYHYGLLLFFIVFTMLSPTDIFPKELRSIMISHLQLKVAPCILVWLYLQFILIKKTVKKEATL